MTIHMIRFRCGENTDDYFIDDWLPQFLTNWSPWVPPDRPGNEAPTLTPVEGDTPAHYFTDWWIQLEEDEENFLEQVWQFGQSYCDWMVMRYHLCDHDEDERAACEWDADRDDQYGEWTSPGEQVPDGLGIED